MTQTPPPGAYYPPPKHPQATTILVLGILGLVLCQIIGPFAWSMGNKAQKEIQANPGAYSGEGEVNAGRIMGIIGTAILGLSLLFLAAMLVIGVGVFATASTTG
ncbi:hypothetical protein [Aeromicrobium sp.]|uniref:hypothetical protein n=1 Tax=Aeromicrobium sp. TaxID=1871063 RepID=UPI002FC93E23